MGFHNAVVGYPLTENNLSGVPSIVKFACEEIKSKGETVNIDDFDDINFDDFCDFAEFMKDYDVVLHRDLTITASGDLVYKFNYEIKVGSPLCCHAMIYILEVSGMGNNKKVDDDDLVDLLEWKTQLVKQGRLSPTSKFSAISNCCS